MRDRDREVWRAVAVFALCFAALVLGGYVAVRRIPALRLAGRPPLAIELPDPTWQLASRGGGAQLDHALLWNDIGGAMENARRADVLIVGNSRTQFAFPADVIREFERSSGWVVFNLALPNESAEFTMRLIEKFDLRPRIVIANSDGFFDGEQSAFATRTIAEGRWGAEKLLFEERVAALLAPHVGRLLPSFRAPRPSWYLLRSTVDGTWLPMRWPTGAERIGTPRPTAPRPHQLAAAKRFRNAMQARGTIVLLTCVPAPNGRCTALSTRALSSKVQVLAFTPMLEGLEVCDGSHLCPSSGARFGKAFFRGIRSVSSRLGLESDASVDPRGG